MYKIGSRWLECLTPNPPSFLFSGSMLPRLQIFMPALTHSNQVFLGLPLLLALGIVILLIEFMHEEERATCPHHLKRLVRRAAVTSCTPNIAQSVSADTSSSSRTPQIQRTIDLSFRRSRCKSGAVGAQVFVHNINVTRYRYKCTTQNVAKLSACIQTKCIYNDSLWF